MPLLSNSAREQLINSGKTTYRNISEIALGIGRLFEPPERLTVSECAAKYRKLNNLGAYTGDWLNEKVFYMVEPMDVLDSRFYDSCVFVGPAQSGKTDALILNWTLFSVQSSAMDLTIYNPSTAAARDFAMRRIDRLCRDSKVIAEKIVKRRDADNKLDKHFTNGMMLTLSWPSVNEMSGKPIPRVALTDYDRMDDDIEGDGNPFDLAAKRTTTFGSYKMALAESSPSKPVLNPRYITKGHEAPPAEGILALYNRGDRRRWYWPCLCCGHYFEGRFSMLKYDLFNKKTGEIYDRVSASETARLECPSCQYLIHPDERMEMQQWGMWIKDGESVDMDGHRTGTGRRTKTASFWLNGMAASFTNWAGLVHTFLTAEEEYQSTQSEEALKKFYNTDLGEPYLPKSIGEERLPEDMIARAEPLPEKMVPAGVRFMVANIDVQKNMFVVQVHGISPGQPFDMVLIDRFQIRKSKRVDEAGEVLWVKPATYLSDWDEIIEQVMEKTYALADGSGKRMAIKMTTCDSGGFSKKKGESTTAMAYSFYRKLRSEGLHTRFHLVKGSGKPGIPRARITHPDAQQRDKNSTARGDVPVMIFNSNEIKDMLHARLDSIEPGKGMYRFPNWLADWWYQEMCAEVRTPAGWEKREHANNEAWDLSYYCIGVCISSLMVVEKMDWANPPNWAAEWDKNVLISEPDQPKRFARVAKPKYDLSQLAEAMA